LTTTWLGERGLSAQQVARLAENGWLRRLGRGAYLLPGDELNRDAALARLVLELPGLHVAGKSALAWRGVRHNLAIKERLVLWGDRPAKLPGWFSAAFASSYQAKLFIRADDVEVKVEVNFVFRGTVLPVERRALTPAAQQKISANVELPVLAPAEHYASKLVAALDRQHPRDLFDVKLMLDTGHRWDGETLDCFVVYLAGHNRPMHEVLFPNLKPLQGIFESEFEGMTTEPADLQTLHEVRGRMLDELPRALLPRHRDFLRSLARADPDWALLAHPHLRHMPALQWKLLNLTKLRKSGKKFAMQHDELAARLGAAI